MLSPFYVFSQKNIKDYFQKAFPGGFQSEFPITDTFINNKEKFLQLYSESHILLQAKIYPVKKGNDLFLIVYESNDMQCNLNIEKVYEIDEINDSLIARPFSHIFQLTGFEKFVDTSYIHKTIYPKYADSLKSYLGEKNAFNQFLEELYDYKLELIESENLVGIHLYLCDYMSRNIIGFSEKDLNYLSNYQMQVFEFKKRKKIFEWSNKKIIRAKF